MGARNERRLLVGIALVAAVLVVNHGGAWLLPEAFEPLKNGTTDRLFHLRSRSASLTPPYDDTLVYVLVDDRSIREMGRLYFDREDHARLVSNLGRARVAAQLHDFILAAPQTEVGDAAIENAAAEANNAFFGMAAGVLRRGDPDDADEAVRAAIARMRWQPDVRGGVDDYFTAGVYFTTMPRLALASRGMGFLDVTPDNDGVYRRAPLIIRDGEGFLPSLPFLVVCDYLGVTPDRVRLEPGRITLRDARRPGTDDAHDIVIPVDRRARMTVNYLGPFGRMTNYPFSTVYEASDDRFMLADLRDEIEGKIAVVSWSSTGSADIAPVPTDPVYPLVGLHANVIHNILTGSFLRELSRTGTFLCIELPLVALLLLASLRLKTIPFLALGFGLAPAYGIAAGLAFLYGNRILDIPGPVLTLLGSTIVLGAYHYHLESRAKAVLRNTFDAYFPPAVVDKIVSQSGRMATIVQKKELTILFSDIKSFTTHTSEMEAGHVRELLNEYFERMIEIVFRHGGTLDKFIGDGLMVFFGDPEDQPDHAVRCVRAAREMQRAARELDRAWRARGDMPLEIRIGINTGHVAVGNMGSTRRLSYTVLGEAVNLAQRLESSAPVGGILVSRRTHELLDGAEPSRALDPIRVKGIARAIEVYEVPVD